jgi:hypothetical protein
MKPPITATSLYNTIIKAAKEHGEDSEPDHEVGDLQDCLGEALKRMAPAQLEALQTELKERELI